MKFFIDNICESIFINAGILFHPQKYERRKASLNESTKAAGKNENLPGTDSQKQLVIITYLVIIISGITSRIMTGIMWSVV